MIRRHGISWLELVLNHQTSQLKEFSRKDEAFFGFCSFFLYCPLVEMKAQHLKLVVGPKFLSDGPQLVDLAMKRIRGPVIAYIIAVSVQDNGPIGSKFAFRRRLVGSLDIARYSILELP